MYFFDVFRVNSLDHRTDDAWQYSGYYQTKPIVDLHVGLGKVPSFSSAQEA